MHIMQDTELSLTIFPVLSTTFLCDLTYFITDSLYLLTRIS